MKKIAALLFLVPLFAFAQKSQYINPTQEDLLTLLSNVWVLYALMLLGTLASQMKQVNVAQQSGSAVTYMGHMFRLREWIVLFITNTLSFAALIYSDQLNFASAVAVGFALNELVDLDPTSSRSSGAQVVTNAMQLKE